MKHKAVFALIIMLIAFQSGISQPRQGERQRPPKHILKGQIKDTDSGQVVEFATVTIYDKKDSTIITGALSDIDGSFQLETPKKECYVVIEFLSYASKTIDPIDFDTEKPFTDLGIILLSQESKIIDDIEITAERSETTFSLDKKVFSVGKDLANRGGSAEDILDNVPSVTVDIDGNVSLRGSQGVRILIDGRPSGLAGVGNTNGLRNIPSNLIKEVEVITNPSARYEAEGMAGIINIVLKKDKGAGFNGAFDVITGIPYALGASANINYRKGKLNWFVNYGINDRTRPGGGEKIQDQRFVDDNGSQLRQLSLQDRDQNRGGLSNSVRFGLDYFLSEKEQITGALIYRKSKEDNLTEIIYTDYIGDESAFSTVPLWSREIDEVNGIDFEDFYQDVSSEPLTRITYRSDNEIEDEKNLEYNVNYRKEFSSRQHTLNANIQYRDKSEVENSIFSNRIDFGEIDEDLPENQRSNNDEGESTLLMQVDFVRPLGKDHKYELGMRSSLRNIKNDFIVEEEANGTYFPIVELSNNFLYDEDVHAIYGIYGNTIGKFSYQGGLRSEYSIIDTRLLQTEAGGNNRRTYTNLFPSGHLNYNFSEGNALQISYSRRIRRPRFWDLNPFFTFSDNRNFFSGNPNLNPEFTDSYELGQIKYWDNLTLNTSIFYRRTTQTINRVLIIDRENTTTIRIPENLGTVDDLGLDLSMSYSGLKWLRLDGNVNIFRNQLSLDPEQVSDQLYNYFTTLRSYTGDQASFEQDYDLSIQETDNITWNGRLTARITFWDSDLQIRTNYRGPRQSAQGQRGAITTVDLGWSKDFLNKKMTATLSVRDVFNSRKRNSISFFDEFVDKSEFQWRSRISTLTLSYRINQKKKRGGNRNNGGGGFEESGF